MRRKKDRQGGVKECLVLLMITKPKPRTHFKILKKEKKKRMSFFFFLPKTHPSVTGSLVFESSRMETTPKSGQLSGSTLVVEHDKTLKMYLRNKN